MACQGQRFDNTMRVIFQSSLFGPRPESCTCNRELAKVPALKRYLKRYVLSLIPALIRVISPSGGPGDEEMESEGCDVPDVPVQGEGCVGRGMHMQPLTCLLHALQALGAQPESVSVAQQSMQAMGALELTALKVGAQKSLGDCGVGVVCGGL